MHLKPKIAVQVLKKMGPELTIVRIRTQLSQFRSNLRSFYIC
jgi:hypothetical protein